MPDISHLRSSRSERLRAAAAAPYDAASMGLPLAAAYRRRVDLAPALPWRGVAPSPSLGRPPRQQGSLHRFFNTGLAVHVRIIVRFLDARGVAYGYEA